MRKSGKRELTPRQIKFIKARAKGKTLGDAAIAAGYNEKNAAQSGFQVEKGIRGRVPELLDRHGLTEESLIKKYLRPLLNANRTVFFQKDGKVTDERKVEALDIRLSALKESFLLHGSYAPRDPKEAAQFGVKIIICDLPGPARENAITVKREE